MTFRSRQLLDLARDEPCVLCNRADGTVVAAHYFGLRRYSLGGGMGHKVTDAAIAFLCGPCHERLDSYADGNTIERSEEFLYAIVATWGRLCERGFVKVNKRRVS